VSDPKVDREAWAAEVTRLIEQEARGNKSAFARMIGIQSIKTVDRWLAQSVNVSEESVRQVARALNLPVTPLLVKVGFLRPSEMPDAAAQLREDDEAITLVEASDAPPSLKRELLEHLRQQRAEHEQQRLAEIRRMLELAERSWRAV
jgi:transcriptional regulator with XRE-family HTH domain